MGVLHNDGKELIHKFEILSKSSLVDKKTCFRFSSCSVFLLMTMTPSMFVDHEFMVVFLYVASRCHQKFARLLEP